jgi:hypothetical protein
MSATRENPRIAKASCWDTVSVVQGWLGAGDQGYVGGTCDIGLVGCSADAAPSTRIFVLNRL